MRLEGLVTKPARGEARKATTCAISSDLPMQPSACKKLSRPMPRPSRAETRTARSPAECGYEPGQTALTNVVERELERERVSPSTPAFAAAQGKVPALAKCA